MDEAFQRWHPIDWGFNPVGNTKGKLYEEF